MAISLEEADFFHHYNWSANQWHREKYTYNFCLLFSLKLE
jgi:hypothetical protein